MVCRGHHEVNAMASALTPPVESTGHGEGSSSTTPPDRPTGWRAYRREIQFLVLFAVLLGGGFTLVAWQPVNDNVVEPFTAAIARVSASILDLFGQETRMDGTKVSARTSPSTSRTAATASRR